MNSNRWFVIVNPSSGNGAGKKLWSRIFERLKCENINFEFHFTEFHKHSVNLTHDAINQGFRRVLIVGGDGTFHNVVNGVMKQTVCASYRITLGIIPIGTGNDWVKTYKIPMKIDQAIDLLLKGRVKQQDVGKITLNDKNKTEVFFNNLAGVGFDGHVVNRVNRYKKHGAMAYMIGAIAGLFSYKNFLAEVNIGAEKIKTKSLMILVGICQYSGGGMQLTNTPCPNDGLFDVSLAKDLTKWQIIKNLGNLYSGKIVKHKLVETFKTTNLEVLDVANSQPIIQADGELIGKGSFQVKIIPKAISFFC
jgi:YegS/Rv2252/BmrU family lipid kinase